jgi:hypothetical protein
VRAIPGVYCSSLGGDDNYVWSASYDMHHSQYGCSMFVPLVYPKSWYQNFCSNSIGVLHAGPTEVPTLTHQNTEIRPQMALHTQYDPRLPQVQEDICLSYKDTLRFQVNSGSQ